MTVWQVYIGRWWVVAPVAVAVASCALGYPVRLVDHSGDATELMKSEE